jgi:hypothetical protein
VLRDVGAQFPQGLYLADRIESIGKGGNERLRDPRIALEEYYVERLHYFPLLLPLGTATELFQRRTGECTLAQTLILMSGVATDAAV